MIEEQEDLKVLKQPIPSFTETEATSFEKEVENFLKENQNLTHEERIDLCLLQLHKEKLSRGQLTNSQAFITRKLLPSMETGGKIDTPTDLKSVVNSYCFILTDGKQRVFSDKITFEDLKCSDPIIAQDILRQMDRKTLSIEEVLEHPLHWNNFLKIHFICKAHAYICDVHHVRSLRDKKVHEKYGMGDLVGIVSENGWIEQLRLRQNEIRQIRKQHHSPVAEDLIYNLATTYKTQSTKKESEKSVFELVRFIRNVSIHIYNHSKDVHIAFGGFPDGFWNFFSSRFPRLFMHVYSHMKTYLCTSDVGREFLQQTSVPDVIYKSLSKNIEVNMKWSFEFSDLCTDTKRKEEDSVSYEHKLPDAESKISMEPKYTPESECVDEPFKPILYESKNTAENVAAKTTSENVESKIELPTNAVAAGTILEDAPRSFIEPKYTPESECVNEPSKPILYESQNLTKAGSAEISLEDTESKGSAELKHKPDSECGDQPSSSVFIPASQNLTKDVATKARLGDAERKSSVELDKQDRESVLFERKNTSENVPAETTLEDVESEISAESKQKDENELLSSKLQTKDVAAGTRLEDAESKTSRVREFANEPSRSILYGDPDHIEESTVPIMGVSKEYSNVIRWKPMKSQTNYRRKQRNRRGFDAPWSLTESETCDKLDAIKLKIDEAYRAMRKTKVFAIENQNFEQSSVEYLCSRLDVGFELTTLELRKCDVNGIFLHTLIQKLPGGTVKNLDLSRNKHLDCTAVKELVVKLKSESLDISFVDLDEDQVKTLGELTMRKLNLNYATFHRTITTALSKLLRSNVEELSLIDSNVTCHQLQELAQAINDDNAIPLRVLVLSHIKLEEKGLAAISTIINRSRKGFWQLHLFGCGIDAMSLNSFTKTIENEISELNIGFNERIVKDGMQAVIEVLRKVKPQKLNLSSLSLEAHHMKQLLESVRQVPITIFDLNLTENPKIQAADVANLVTEMKIRKLNTSECKFSKEDFVAFAENMKNYKLDLLRHIEISRQTAQNKQWREEVSCILKNVSNEVFIFNSKQPIC